MAKKSKADAAASGKVTKAKSTPSKAKKRTRSKKMTIETTQKKAVAPVAAFDPSVEQIQMRAYFISERRRRFDLPGDANSDWLEAKRQLLAETRH